ncbi:MAG: Crp/Fnr family transcriptional regulator [Pseudomonadota bacterium]
MPEDKDAAIIPDCLQGAQTVSLPRGHLVFQAGDPCSQFFYLLSGSIRVDLISKSGKAIMLYRFGGDETCVLTTSCLLGGDDYCAEAHVEEDARACVLSQAAFEERLGTSAAFRHLVFASFSQRLAEMMGKIEEVAFAPIDARLANWLLTPADASDPHQISVTHEKLAADLGTAREVISRKLSQWERLDIIARGRGVIQILDPNKLRRMATLGD